MTTDCTPARFSCPTPYGARPKSIEAGFSGGTITSHAGLLLAGLTEGHMRLFDRIAGCFADFLNPDLIVHEVRSMVSQRILGLIAGFSKYCPVFTETCSSRARAGSRSARA